MNAMKKILAIAVLGIPLGCAASICLMAVVIATMLNSCTTLILGGGKTQASSGTTSFLINSPGAVALEAIALDSHLSGTDMNNYDPSDPFMQSVISYWKATCQNKDGSLCDSAAPNNLQCVEFVTGAFSLAGISLPYAHDAHYFWPDYQDPHVQSAWQEIAAGSGLPEMGDIVVWHTWHYDAQQGARVEDAGHVAIVVDVVAPQGKKSGTIYLAQANAPGSITVGQALTQNTNGLLTKVLSKQVLNTKLGILTIYPDLSVADNKNLVNVPDSSGSVVDGYIRHIYSASPTFSLPPNQMCDTSKMHHIYEKSWVPVACNDANNYHISSQLFINQMYVESQFDPYAESHDKKTGAVIAEGIAQFTAATAAGLGIDPFNPVAALDAASHLMSKYYCGYLSGDFNDYMNGKLKLSDCDTVVATHSASQRDVAYQKALAAYNGGPGVVAGAVANCGNARWYSCLGSDVQSYIHDVFTL